MTLPKPIRFSVSNGSSLICDKIVIVPIKTDDGSTIHIKALVSDQLFGYDLIIGDDSLNDIKAVMDYDTHVLTYRITNVKMRTNHDISLKPGESKLITLTGKFPGMFQNSDIHLVMTKYMSRFCPPEILVTVKNGKTTIRVTNTTSRNVYISRRHTLAFAKLSTNGQLLEKVNLESTEQNALQSYIYSLTPAQLMDRDQLQKDLLEKFPHLTKEDEKSRLFDDEILRSELDLSSPLLDDTDRKNLFNVLKKNVSAFSLRGEIGKVKDYRMEFKVKSDLTPFNIRPYTVTESCKDEIDAQLEHLCKLGVIKKGISSYTSPLYFVPKKDESGKISKKRRLVTDFRYLNQFIMPENMPFTLINETLNQVGRAEPSCISVIDIQNAFFNIPLSEECQKFTGFYNYHSGTSYLYNRLPMGLNCSPARFSRILTEILDELKDRRKFCVPYLDDLLIFSPDKESHIRHIDMILGKLAEKGFKLSPKKCSFFKQELKYMGHLLKIDGKKVTLHVTDTRIEAIMRLPRPNT